ADASAPDRDGWQTVAVDPSVVALRVAGLSTGFLLFDDTGTEWTRDGEKFTTRHLPNRFIYSREQNRASAPYLTVALGPADRNPPASVGPVTIDPSTADLPASEAVVTWATPRDAGPAGTVGFLAEIDGRPVPHDLVPLAGAPGESVRMHVRDLGLKPGA